ncbi:Scr1 family TA system antitoxin-like transcriptional regulator [Crossiella sp. CA198]|uniref:Scr1 family TA system antitoxin-like transcriptional regulator n=1 Tax=Crossiella sp. CA198 TaxID=3455607 RepID=UPI003F8D2418
MTPSATTARRLLGLELRSARNRVGLSQSALAAKSGCGQVTITRYEQELGAVKPEYLRRIVQALRIKGEDADNLFGLALASRSRTPWLGERKAVAEWVRFVYETECDTSQILNWNSERLPGPLQSEHFMLALHGLDGATNVTPQVAMRTRRRELFDSSVLENYGCILGEAFFERVPFQLGSAAALDQVRHLLDLAEHPKISFQVLPFTARIRHLESDFMVMKFPEAQLDYAFVEYLNGAKQINPDEGLDAFEQEWQKISEAAWNTAKSQDYLTELAKRLAGP